MNLSRKRIHGLSTEEWYARAIRERGGTESALFNCLPADGEEVRVVFVLKGYVGPLCAIVDRFVSEVWPFYVVTEHCETRHGHIVTVEEGPPDAP